MSCTQGSPALCRAGVPQRVDLHDFNASTGLSPHTRTDETGSQGPRGGEEAIMESSSRRAGGGYRGDRDGDSHDAPDRRVIHAHTLDRHVRRGGESSSNGIGGPARIVGHAARRSRGEGSDHHAHVGRTFVSRRRRRGREARARGGGTRGGTAFVTGPPIAILPSQWVSGESVDAVVRYAVQVAKAQSVFRH